MSKTRFVSVGVSSMMRLKRRLCEMLRDMDHDDEIFVEGDAKAEQEWIAHHVKAT